MSDSFTFNRDYLESVEPDGQSVRIFDQDCPGLAVFISRDGQTRVYYAYLWEEGMEEPAEVEIGPVSRVPIEKARLRAQEIVLELSDGKEFPVIRNTRGTGQLFDVYGPPAPMMLDETTFRKPGECQKCLDMTLLNSLGLCSKCQPLPPCHDHPGVESTGKCRTCREHYCGQCLAGGRCGHCTVDAQVAAPKGKPGAQAKGPAKPGAHSAAAKPAAKGTMSVMERLKANPKQALGIAVAVLVLVQGGMFAWQSYQNATPPLSAEETYESRLSQVQRGVQAYQALNKKLPADAAAVSAFLKSQGVSPPNVTGETSPLPGDAVVYVVKGDTFEAYATTTDGKRYEPTAVGRTAAPAD